MPVLVTRLADIVNPIIFNDYRYQYSVLTSAFIKSGILARSEEYDMMAGGKGSATITPSLRPFTGRAIPWKADGTNTNDSIKQSSVQMNTPFLHRRIKMGWNYLASHIAGIQNHYRMGNASWGFNAAIEPGDKTAALLHYVVDFWNEDLQQTIFAMLRGCFASTTNVASWVEGNGKNPGLQDLILDSTLSAAQVTANTPIGIANRISPVTIGAAQSLLGERGGKVMCIAMHPDCYWKNIQPNNITPNLQTTSQNWDTLRYLNLDIILDDTLPVDRTNPLYPKYTNYLFAQNSILFGDYKLDAGIGAEISRDVDQAEDFLTTRRKDLVQMAGMSYAGPLPASGDGPSDADLALAANWQRADDIKNMGIVQLITNT